MCVYVCICVFMCVYVCICVYMCVYVCICVYMCVYVFIYYYNRFIFLIQNFSLVFEQNMKIFHE